MSEVVMRYDIFERSFSGFENQEQAEAWVNQVENHFKQSFENWKDWQTVSTIKFRNNKIAAEFKAEYAPQQ